METSIVFARTHKGEEELGTRKYGLSMTLRRGLILVDGKADVAKIIEKAVGIPDVVACLRQLEQEGYVTTGGENGGPPASDTGHLKTRLIEAARAILGEHDAEKVITKIQRAPDTREGLEETLRMCKKLVKLTIDEEKAEALVARCKEIMKGEA